MSVFDKIIMVDDFNDYFQEETKKTQVTLHHTVSPPNNSLTDIAYWKSTDDKISTCVVIQGDGKIFQCFSSKYWGWHLGVPESTFHNMGIPYKNLNKIAIGVEIDSWGGLVKHTDGKWYPALWDKFKKKHVPYLKAGAIKEYYEIPEGFRGYYAFQKYTPEQIQSVKDLLLLWNERYGIPLHYNEDMWNISKNALLGTPGIWSHVSYRRDKSDAWIDPDLIFMLKSLT